MDGFLLVFTLATALGCGLVAGVFFAFSSFVMKGLARLAPAQAAAAMQAINVAAVTPAFMVALFGTALASLALGIWSVVEWDEPYAAYLLAGSGLYVLGVVVLTMAFHVPRNNALAALDPGGPGAADQWARYLSEWTAANHIRAAAGLAAAAVFVLAIHAA